MTGRLLVGLVAAVGVLCGGHAMSAVAKPPNTFNPVVEAQNFSITQQRQAIYDTPAYQAQLAADSAASTAAGAGHRGRRPGPLLHRRPVLEPRQRLRRRHPPQQLGRQRLRARAPGAVHRARRRDDLRPRVGDRRRAGQAAGDRDHRRLGAGRRADVLVRRPDAGQGRLRRAHLRPPGPGPVRHLRPVARPGRGRPRADRRAPRSTTAPRTRIDFLLSTPQHPYEPVPSCTTGTSHAAKQNARVAAGLDAAYNPFWSCSIRREIGLAGHSYGAAGVSYIGQWDPRVKAVVALDNLGGPGPDDGRCPARAGARRRRSARSRMSRRSRRPHHGPDHQARARHVGRLRPAAGAEHLAAGSRGQVDVSRSPTPRPASTPARSSSAAARTWTSASSPTRRSAPRCAGPDIIDWYTTAWFDKYLKHEPAADARLLTERWRDDPVEAGDRPQPRRQRVLVLLLLAAGHPPGRRAAVLDCEDLRDGCAGMVPESADGFPGTYSYLKVDTAPTAASRTP